eukprot:scaffold10735_cov124-Isochrysis_galbana.AAC.2
MKGIETCATHEVRPSAWRGPYVQAPPRQPGGGACDTSRRSRMLAHTKPHARARWRMSSVGRAPTCRALRRPKSLPTERRPCLACDSHPPPRSRAARAHLS